MILLKNVSKSYRNGVHALRDINLEIEEGEFVYIIGPTGCGKSTLIKLLDGEELPDQGEVYVAETNVGKLRHSRVPPQYRCGVSGFPAASEDDSLRKYCICTGGAGTG